MNSSAGFVGSMIGHLAFLALLLGLASSRGCVDAPPEPLGGFTMVELSGGEPPSEPTSPTPAPQPPNVKVPDPTPVPDTPDPEAIKLPEKEKPKPPKPPKPPEIKKTEVKPKPPDVKKPDPVKKPVKPPEPKRDLVKELRDRLKTPPTTPNGRTFAPVGPTTSTGTGGTSGNTHGTANGSAAAGRVEEELYRKLYAMWDQPRGVSSFMTTDIFLKIATSGVITEVRLVKPSGDEAMDRSVLAAARAVRAVTPLPRELRSGYETTFRFKVQN